MSARGGCAMPRCRSRETVITWLGKELCAKCWERSGDDSAALREKLGIKEEEPEKEAAPVR